MPCHAGTFNTMFSIITVTTRRVPAVCQSTWATYYIYYYFFFYYYYYWYQLLIFCPRVLLTTQWYCNLYIIAIYLQHTLHVHFNTLYP